MSLPADIARALASGDKETARKLAGVIAGQMARGECHGFDSELAALKKLCGTDAPLGKLAKAVDRQKGTSDGRDAVLAPDLRARVEVAISAFDNATGDVEKASAERQLRKVHDDILSRQAFAATHAAPRRAGSPAELRGFFR